MTNYIFIDKIIWTVLNIYDVIQSSIHSNFVNYNHVEWYFAYAGPLPFGIIFLSHNIQSMPHVPNHQMVNNPSYTPLVNSSYLPFLLFIYLFVFMQYHEYPTDNDTNTY